MLGVRSVPGPYGWICPTTIGSPTLSVSVFGGPGTHLSHVVCIRTGWGRTTSRGSITSRRPGYSSYDCLRQFGLGVVQTEIIFRSTWGVRPGLMDGLGLGTIFRTGTTQQLRPDDQSSLWKSATRSRPTIDLWPDAAGHQRDPSGGAVSSVSLGSHDFLNYVEPLPLDQMLYHDVQAVRAWPESAGDELLAKCRRRAAECGRNDTISWYSCLSLGGVFRCLGRYVFVDVCRDVSTCNGWNTVGSGQHDPSDIAIWCRCG